MELGRTTAERLSTVAHPRLRPLWRRYLPGIGGSIAVVIGCITWEIANFGSPYYGWLYASGVRVLIEPTSAAIATAQEGEPRDTVFVVRNLTDRPVRIVGCSRASDDRPRPTRGPVGELRPG